MQSSRARQRSRLKSFLSAALLIAALLLPFLAIEAFLRFADLDRPRLASPFVTVGFESIHRNDAELFFSLRPNLDIWWQDAQVVTNSLGMRSPEVSSKQEREFRILSLGESTTFGARVENEETYSALLEKQLQRRDPTRQYTVMNAGVCAFSSFQSLRYLEDRGLALEPDLILFYHEINDFLPSSIRETASPEESGLALTDRQLYESRRIAVHRWLLSSSAIYRLLSYNRSRARLVAEADTRPRAAVDHTRIPSWFSTVTTREGNKSINLPQRVTVEERKANLAELADLAEAHDVALVMIHPSYAESTRHECELTEFGRREAVAVFEAYDSLHPPGAAQKEFFVDLWHPSAEGHALLARALFDYLVDADFVPSPR